MAVDAPSGQVLQHAKSTITPRAANGKVHSHPSDCTNIVDIRRDVDQQSLQNAIRQGLRPEHGGEKRLPTLLLYDEAGLKLFEDITYLDEYYLTNAEIHVLERHADQIAQCLQPGSIIVELGSGNLRKVDILLRAIDCLGKHVDYYALDLSLSELERTLSAVQKDAYKHVRCFGLHGTYDDGLEWLKTPEVKAKPRAVLSLGSSIGNFPRNEAAAFLRTFVDILQPTDCLLIGIDGCKDAARVRHAYNDRQGVTNQFYANGLLNANHVLGSKVFDIDQWDILGDFNEEAGRHEAFVAPKKDVTILGTFVKQGEKVRLEEAYKYDAQEVSSLWEAAGVVESFQWSNASQNYALHMIQKNKSAMPSNPNIYAAQPVPTWDQWVELWALWDIVTRQMIPDEELLEKPIKLRNACIFYLGHIPTFLDMKLTGATNGVPTPPDYFPKIFERGIDPDVDNPEQCHAHSEIPDTWPPLPEILAFQGRVRDRIKRLYDSAEAANPRLGRVLWLGYEHEAMHLETLLYMLIQSEKTLPPPSTPVPNFEVRAQQAKAKATINEWFTVPERDIVIGIQDPETDSGAARHFGWDVEKPPRTVHVPAFIAKARPITIGDYAKYLQQTGSNKIPASWTDHQTTKGTVNIYTKGCTNGHTNGLTNGHTDDAVKSDGDANDNPTSSFLLKHGVRTVYGAVPLPYALSWPVSASYDELKGCAAWMGGRIPTFEEARSIYSYVDQKSKQALAEKALGKTIPAVNGHLVNDGVEETPPAIAVTSGDVVGDEGLADGAAPKEGNVDPHATFVDLTGCNVGFKNWQPTPVTQNGGRLSGQGDFGGLWEWTSTALSRHEGYEEMPLYPAYSSDFFDDKHNIVLGGSWATVPRIAGRKSFVNWYQRNYPYVWAGARLVRDL